VLTLLGKAMLNLDGTIRVLSPTLDPVQLIRDYMVQVMEKRVAAQLAPGRSFALLLDAKRLAENLPRHADLTLDKLANDHLTLRLELERLDALGASLTRAADRVALSMGLSALIVAGSIVWAARRAQGLQPTWRRGRAR
jgi:ubiquinone biosynthesis protein